MTIDIANERAIPLTEALEHFPGSPHISTVFRWANLPVSRRLETLRCGGKRFTTREAIERFIARCSADDGTTPQPSRGRKKEIARAESTLAEAGIA